MKVINEHIKSQSYKNLYLIYGPEDYLRKQYRDRLRDALMDGQPDTMNYSYFEGKGIDVKEVIRMAETLPFFSERRVIVIENSGFFNSSHEDLTEYLKQLPETTVMLFVDDAVDKRNKTFKTVTDLGYAAQMSSPDEETLRKWILGMTKKEGKQISGSDVQYFLSLVEPNMENIRQELEKIFCYTLGRPEITQEDIDQLTTGHTENKIFEMLEALAQKRTPQAMKLYGDLLMLKEPPMRILYLLTRQFNMVLIVKDLAVKGYPLNIIAERTRMKPFVVRKNMNIGQHFSEDELAAAVEYCTRMEEAVKTGKLTDQIALELVIHKYKQ